MPTKANILITELFDTELIGEGALPSYEHAHQNLVQVCVKVCLLCVFVFVFFGSKQWNPNPSVFPPTGELWGSSSSSHCLRSAGGVGAAVELGSAAAGGRGGRPPGPSTCRWSLCWSSFRVWHPAEPSVAWQFHTTGSSLHHVQVGMWERMIRLGADQNKWQIENCHYCVVFVHIVSYYSVFKVEPCVSVCVQHYLSLQNHKRTRNQDRMYLLRIIYFHLYLIVFHHSVDFSKPVSSAFHSFSSQFVAQSGGRAQVVLSWWDLDMDPSGSIVCTMAPSWTYQQPQMAPVSWVVMSPSVLSVLHLCQHAGVFFSGGTTGCRVCISCLRRKRWKKETSSVWLSAMTTTVCGTVCSLPGRTAQWQHNVFSCHGETWSDNPALSDPANCLCLILRSKQTETIPSRPCCTCQAHLVWNRPRFGELNDRHRNESFIRALRSVSLDRSFMKMMRVFCFLFFFLILIYVQVLREDSVCLSVSDGSLLPVFAHKLGAKKVLLLWTWYYNMM